MYRGSFPGGSVVQNPLANAGNMGWIPGWARPPGGGNGNPLQYSYLKNPMDKGARRATIHGVTKSQTRLSNFTSLTSLTSYFITGEGNGNTLQYSCLENPMDRGAWLAMVHGVAESDKTEGTTHAQTFNEVLL